MYSIDSTNTIDVRHVAGTLRPAWVHFPIQPAHLLTHTHTQLFSWVVHHQCAVKQKDCTLHMFMPQHTDMTANSIDLCTQFYIPTHNTFVCTLNFIYEVYLLLPVNFTYGNTYRRIKYIWTSMAYIPRTPDTHFLLFTAFALCCNATLRKWN